MERARTFDPFAPAPDPFWYVERSATRVALRRMEEWTGSPSRVATLVGPSGIGKTLLIQVLADRTGKRWRIAYMTLPRPSGALDPVVAAALSACGAEPAGARDPGEALRTASRACAEGESEGLLLVIDDAASMLPETAEQLARLVAGAGGSLRLLVAVDSDLVSPGLLSAFGESATRVPIDSAMSRRETAHYIAERLRRAGQPEAKGAPLGRLALSRLVRRSGGIPAIVNVQAAGLLEHDLQASPEGADPDGARRHSTPTRPRRPPEPELDAPPPSPASELPDVHTGDLILVAGDRLQRSAPAPARELYTSVLFRKRRFYAEQSGRPWFVLSARHGLVDPDTQVEPDSKPLSSLRPAQRSAWSAQLARDLLEPIARTGARSVEILAGSTVLDFGLVEALTRLGVTVIAPHRGLPVPDQVRWLDLFRARLATASLAPVETVVPTAEHAIALASDFAAGRLTHDPSDLKGPPNRAGWDRLPEALATARLRRRGATPTTVRHFLSLLSAVEGVGTHAEGAWSRGSRLWIADPDVFEPGEVTRRSFRSLVAALERYGIGTDPVADAGAWRNLCETLEDPASPVPVRLALAGQVVEGPLLYGSIRARRSDGSAHFPALARDPVAPRWIRRLAWPGLTPIKDLDRLPPAVDDDVWRATRQLGLIDRQGNAISRRRDIERVWREVARLAGCFGAPPPIDGTAVGLEPALVHLGRGGCCREAVESQSRDLCRLCRYPTRARVHIRA